MSMAHFACYLLGTAGDIGADCVLQFFCHEQLLRPDWTLAYVYREYWNNPLQDMMMTFRVAKREARKSAAGAPAAAPPALHGGADARGSTALSDCEHRERR
ncbi:hypothetical protein KFE25_012929 [Diacronema lutheri]|uniref:Uncharacterized protein n=1 Tax=Diacronema lutheri TaxID=2081491 RepID=A0A8J5X5A8_DIALT|nr:hypothetical protein KFE25_012929 [Diacronema lutheri]